MWLLHPLLAHADTLRSRGANDGTELGHTRTQTVPESPSATLPATDVSTRAALFSLVRRLAQHHGIDARLLHAIITVESGFDPWAVSHAGAQGLMQLMPATALRYAVDNPFDPRANIEGGIRYLKTLFARYPGDLRRVLAAYNAGEDAVERHGGIPPYPETQRYVARIMTLYGMDTTPEKIYRYRTASGGILFTNVPR
jgi:soluble lytic murein transglycosylase-like protein